MEISNPSAAELKTLVIRLHNKRPEMKDTLIKIKNNLQGINSRVDEAKNQINDLEYKEAKNNQSEQQEEKRIPPK